MEVGSAAIFGQCHLLIRTQCSRRFCKVQCHLEEVELKYLLYSVEYNFLTRRELRSSKDVSFCQKIQSRGTKDI